MKIQYFLFACMALVLSSCGKNEPAFDPITQWGIDSQLIRAYIADNNLIADSTATGLHFVIDNPGSSARPNINNTVDVHYSGTFLNGTEFDKSGADPATFPLTGVIQGWTEGLQLFGKGGTGQLLIPSHLAYGRFGRGAIPGNTVLLFDINLVDFR